MPHYEVDPEMLEEMAEYGMDMGDISAGATYVPASATFDDANLSGGARLLRDALVAKGITVVECRYDGGYDEGFSYFDHAVADGQRMSATELANLFAEGPLAEASLEPPIDGPYPAGYRDQMRERLATIPAAQRIEGLIEELAESLAVVLLGEGYGTGEMSLRGRYRADLQSGEIEDIEEIGETEG